MSRLQQIRQAQHRTPSYDASFEAWKVRPVYLVQCIGAQTTLLMSPALIRVRPEYRDEEQRIVRSNTAARLRHMRRNGLDRAEVQRLALLMIDAPESYAGQKRGEARQRVRDRLSELCANRSKELV